MSKTGGQVRGMGARSLARKLALQALYGWQLNPAPWQDLGVDYRRGRLYLPADVSGRLRAQEGDLAAGLWTDPWRQALDEVARRTRILFDQGRAIGELVSGRLRFELRLTWLGGRLILERAAAPGRNPLVSRPTLGAGDVPGLLWQAARWRGK